MSVQVSTAPLPASAMQPNPLLLNLVVEKVCKFLKPKELMECRRVCRIWSDVIQPLLEDKINEIQVQLFIPERHNLTGTHFLDTMSKSDVRFTNYYFHDLLITKYSLCNQIFNKFGEDMTKLKLKNNDTMTSSQLANILCNTAPFLEELELCNLPIHVASSRLFKTGKLPQLELKKIVLRWQGIFPFPGLAFSDDFLNDMFQACQQLESLSLSSKYSIGGDQTEFGILKSFLKKGNIANLSELSSNVEQNLLTLLSTKLLSCPLTKFSGYFEEDFDVVCLDRFLSAHKDTLKTLDLRMGHFRLRTLKPMKNLRELSISVFCSSANSGFFEEEVPDLEFDWGAQFPSLITLKLKDQGTKYADGFPCSQLIDGSPCPTLRNLHLPPELSDAGIQELARIFPNVRKVVVPHLQDNSMRELWNAWPNLRTLFLSPHYFDIEIGMYEGDEVDKSDDSDEEKEKDCHKGKNVDSEDDGFDWEDEEEESECLREKPQNFNSLLTGFPNESLKLIRDANRAENPLPESEIEALRTFPSLLNLKELDHLVFLDNGFLSKFTRLRSRISDQTCTLVLNKMTSLKTIFIPRGLSKITPSCLETLCEELDLMDASTRGNVYLVKYDWQKKLKDFIDLETIIPDYI